jgi:hypothetical protein
VAASWASSFAIHCRKCRLTRFWRADNRKPRFDAQTLEECDLVHGAHAAVDGRALRVDAADRQQATALTERRNPVRQ